MNTNDFFQTTTTVARLLNSLFTVHNFSSFKIFMDDFCSLLPKESRTILVVGAKYKNRHKLHILHNVGWDSEWLFKYHRKKLHLYDPIWNGPCSTLLIWSHYLKSKKLPLQRKFVNFAKNAGYEFGLSWKEQLENRSIFLSSTDGDIENNDIARILFSTLAKNICFVANRILNENPSIMTITEKELNPESVFPS